MVKNNQRLAEATNSLLQFFDGFKQELLVEIKNALLSEEKSKSQVYPTDEVLSRRDAAKLLNCSLTTLCQYQKDGIIPFYKIGRKVLFKREEILVSIRKQIKKGGAK